MKNFRLFAASTFVPIAGTARAVRASWPRPSSPIRDSISASSRGWRCCRSRTWRTTARRASARRAILITELLASGAVDVVEPGEVQAVLARVVRGRGAPSKSEILELGRELDVQAVMTGSVTQSEVLRSGTVSVPVVTLDLHLLETETGAAVWAVTHTERGSGAAAKWLGTGAEPISATTRKCVQEALRSLFG